MGTDDIFKRKRAQKLEQKKENRIPKPNSFLILSEGEKTEPYYFDGLSKYINNKYKDHINLNQLPIIDTQGEGKCTVSLVNAAAKYIARSSFRYEKVWVVFDKDDFNDFDDAIDLAHQYNFRVAWSNQSFEFWIYLHFNYSDAALHRDDWVEKISEIFKLWNISKNGYTKNDPDVFKLIVENVGLKNAISNAKRIESQYAPTQKPSQCDPCTTVHHLILEFEEYLQELL